MQLRSSFRTVITVVSAIVFVATAHSCGAQPAQQSGPAPYRPLVFLPGILGTELLDQDGELAWGGTQSFKRFAELEITDKGPVKPLRVGKPIRSVSILGPFWTVHQYDSLFKLLKDLNYREGETLFVFPYDWRYSNFETAAKLKAFIDAQPALQGQEFDILAHSMGGIVSRIYMQKLGGAARVKRFIGLGVPALGAMNSLATMSAGWGNVQNYLAGGIDTIRRVVFSFPSLYQLFPSYDDCCRVGDENKYTTFDPADVDVWKAGDWIPAEHRGTRLALFEAALTDAKEVRTLMRQPLPQNVEQVLFAGDFLGTHLYFYVDPANRSWTKWRFSKNRGDGTVPLWSAAPTGVGRSLPSFSDHATIFSDKWVANTLQRMLNKNQGPPPISQPGAVAIALSKAGRDLEVALVDASFDPPIASAGGRSQLNVSIKFNDQVERDEISPTVVLDGPSGRTPLTVENVTTSADLDFSVLRFAALIETVAPGAYSVRITVPGMATYTRDILVLNPL
jgi:pimeloyl-ACP methyl ester carboxylesterase